MNTETKLEVLRQLVYLTQTYANNGRTNRRQNELAEETHDRAMAIMDELGQAKEG